MKITVILLATVVATLHNCSPARGELLVVANASFEDPVLVEDTWTDGDIPSWVITGTEWSAGVFRPGPTWFPGGATDGVNTAWSNGKDISQVLPDVLLAGMEYTLQVDIGDHLKNVFPSYRVQLFAGNELLAEDNNSLTPPNGQFVTSTVSYTSLTGNPHLGAALEIRLVNASSSPQINWDNVRLDATTVPEPSTISLFTMTGLVGAFVAWRKRKRT